MTQTRLEAFKSATGSWDSFRSETVAPEPATALGVGVTTARLDNWRDRSANGPYRVAGDAGTNTPGDWSRIESNRNSFVSSPPPYWNPTYANGSYWEGGDPEPSLFDGHKVQDAAFWAMVENDSTVADQVMGWLDGQANVDQADFRNTSKFRSTSSDAYFSPLEWLLILALAYSYANVVAGGTSAQRTNVREWLKAGGLWRGPAVFDSQGDNFWTDRYNLVPKDHPTSFNNEKTHSEGHNTCTCHRSTNNRRLAILVATGVTGMVAEDQTMIDMATQYVKEYLCFGFWPDIDFTEMHRASTGTFAQSETGWGYVSSSVSMVLTYSDFLRVRGDTSLFDFSTRVGYHGSECVSGDPDKTMLNFAKGFARYGSDTFARYGDNHTTGDEDQRLDGRYPRDGSTWRGNLEHCLSAANAYYNDSELEAAYKRDTSAGFVDFWSNPSNGDRDWRGGGGGPLPGMLFLYGQTEGVF